MGMKKKGLGKRMTNYGTKAKKRWLYQNYQAVNAELNMLHQQQGR